MCIQTKEAHSEKKNTTDKQKNVYTLKMLLFKAVCLTVFKQEAHDKAFWETGERENLPLV